MNKDSVDVRFDKSRRIRVLASTDYGHYQSMANECDAFISNLENFKQTSQRVMKDVSKILHSIEEEKMMVIGKRNVVENEDTNRKRKINDLQLFLKEKESEIQQIYDHNKSLDKVIATQEGEMEKIRYC